MGELAPGEVRLCRLDEIPDGQSRGFLPGRRRIDQVFAVRRGEAVHVYRNLCPHNWIGLDYAPDKFLTADGSEIVCYGHGAHFSVTTGVCIAGVCEGKSLRKLRHRIEDGDLIVTFTDPRAALL